MLSESTGTHTRKMIVLADDVHDVEPVKMPAER